MDKRHRDVAPQETTSDSAASTNTLFVDTNLDTHLALIVSDSDTVSDVKEKIILEHLSCFPEIGEININAMKVRRRGNFYHLSDSMLLNSAFGGIKKNWFLSVDALTFKLPVENLQSFYANTSNQPSKLFITNYPAVDEQVVVGELKGSTAHESTLPHHGITGCENNGGRAAITESCSGVLKDVEINENGIFKDQTKSLFSAVNPCPIHEMEKEDVERVLDVQHNTSDDQFCSAKSSRKKKHRKGSTGAVSNHVIVKEDLQSLYVENERNKTLIQEASEASLKEDTDLVTGSHKESLKLATVSAEIPAKENKKRKIAVTENLKEPSEFDSPKVSSGAKKKKKKARQDSSVKDAGENRYMDAQHISQNSHDAAVIPNDDLHPQTLTESFALTKKQKENVDVLRKMADGSDDQKDQASAVKHKSDTHEKTTEFEEEGRDILKKYHGNDIKEINPSSAEDPHKVNQKGEGLAESELTSNNDGKRKSKKSAKRNRNRLGVEDAKDAVGHTSSTLVDSKNDCLPVETTDSKTIVHHEETKPELAVPEKWEFQNYCKIDLKAEEPIISSNPSDAKFSDRGRRTKKKAKKSLQRNQESSHVEHANDTVGDVSVPKLCPAVDNVIVEDKEEVELQKSKDIFLACADKEGDNMSGIGVYKDPQEDASVVGKVSGKARKKVKETGELPMDVQGIADDNLLVTGKSIQNVENLKKPKRKTKKHISSAAKRNSDVPDREKEVTDQEVANLNEGMREVVSPTGTGSKASPKQLSGSQVERDKQNEISGDVGLHSVDLPPVLSSRALGNNCSGRSEGGIDAAYQLEGSKSDDVNFKDYFVLEKLQNESSLADALEEGRSDRDFRTVKSSKKVDSSYADASSAVERSLELNVNSESQVKVPFGNSNTAHIQKTSFKGGHAKISHQSKASARSFDSGVKGMPLDNIVKIGISSGQQFRGVNSSGNNGFVRANSKSNDSARSGSSSSTKGSVSPLKNKLKIEPKSGFHISSRKSLGKDKGEAANSSQKEWRLLNTTSAIFDDAASGSSMDEEDNTVDSDCSTCLPSDRSYTSAHSEERIDSSTIDANGAKAEDGGGKFGLNSKLSGSKNLPMDMILRQSNRFRNAKLTASQSQQEDSESQPVEFVPDSQANL